MNFYMIFFRWRVLWDNRKMPLGIRLLIWMQALMELAIKPRATSQWCMTVPRKWGDARSSSRALNHICGQSIDHYYKQFFLKGGSKRSLEIPYKASTFCFLEFEIDSNRGGQMTSATSIKHMFNLPNIIQTK